MMEHPDFNEDVQNKIRKSLQVEEFKGKHGKFMEIQP
jgi:hypothetical protein